VGKTAGSAVHSMTGVGLAAGAAEPGELRIEVRSVNGRSLSVKLRASSALAAYEAAIEEAVRQALHRGTVSVVVERTAATTPLPDRQALRAVAAELRELAAELQLPPPTLAEVVSAAQAAQRADVSTSRPLPERFQRLLAAAIDDLVQHRRKEGASTAAFVLEQLDALARHAEAAAERAPRVVAEYGKRLLERVQEFVAAHTSTPVTAGELVREVAAFADRVDVGEELQRLAAHIGEVRAVFARGGEVGRRLEFLLQELLRETNTLGSKSPDAELAHTVVAMKTCIDRMKEQVANLE
jgi:uncharacterized protein (TIGR00255 family)